MDDLVPVSRPEDDIIYRENLEFPRRDLQLVVFIIN